MVIGVKSENGEQSSNSDLVCYVHIHTNTIGKGWNQSSSTPDMA